MQFDVNSMVTATFGDLAQKATRRGPLDEVAIGSAILRLADDVDLRRDLSARERAYAQRFTSPNSLGAAVATMRRL